MCKKVEILVATHNGEKYLSQQLDSLISQTYENYTITIRDDLSTDDTRRIIKLYTQKHPDLIHELIDDKTAGNPSENFGILLESSTAEYVMFCDQDDVWLPNKVSNAVKKIINQENFYGKDTPILVHSDLIVVDEELKIISPSLWKYQNLDSRWGEKFSYSLTQNIVTGCTMIMNRSLIEKASPIPKEAAMHDWWITIVACAYGIVETISESEIHYRQHGKNNVGAKKFNIDYIKSRFIRPGGLREDLSERARQAQVFYSRYDGPAAVIASNFYGLLHQDPLSKRINIIKHRFWKVGLIRNIGWFLRV